MNISEFRVKHPEYDDMDDQTLASALYKKSYSDIPKAEFDAKFLGAPAPVPTTAEPKSDTSFSAGIKVPYQPPNLFMKGLTGLNKNIDEIGNKPDMSAEAKKGQQLIGRDAALLGFGNEAEAALRSVFGEKKYAEYMQEMQNKKAKTWAENPSAAMSYSLAGGMGAGAGAMSVLKPYGLLENIIAQGTLGAIEGAGTNEQDRLKGGLIGGGLGVAIPTAISTGQGLWNFGKNVKNGVKTSIFGHPTLTDAAAERQAGRLTKNYFDKVGAPENITAGRGLVPGATIADGSDEGLALATAAVKAPNPAVPSRTVPGKQVAVTEGLPELKKIIGGRGTEVVKGSRPANTYRRILGAVKEATGDTLESSKAKLMAYSEKVRTNARPNYAAVSEQGELSAKTQTKLKNFIFGDDKASGRPAMKKALEDSIKAAKNRGKKLGYAKSGKSDEAVDGLLDDIKWELSNEGDINASAKKLSEMLEGNRDVKITAEMADDITRFLGDKIHEVKLAGGDNTSVDLMKIRDAWVKLIDSSDDLVRLTKARTQYDVDLKPVKAYDLGYENFDKMTVDEIDNMFKGFSLEEKRAFQEGVSANINVKGVHQGSESANLWDSITREGSSYGKGNVGAADKIQKVFGDEADAILSKAQKSERAFAETQSALSSARKSSLSGMAEDSLSDKFKGMLLWGKRRAYSPTGVGFATADAVLEAMHGGGVSPQVLGKLRKTLLSPEALADGTLERILAQASVDDAAAIQAVSKKLWGKGAQVGAIPSILGAGKEDK